MKLLAPLLALVGALAASIWLDDTPPRADLVCVNFPWAGLLHVYLTAGVVSPRDDRTVVFESQAVSSSGRDRREIGVRRRRGAGTVPPRHDRAVGLQAETLIPVRDDCHEIRIRSAASSYA